MISSINTSTREAVAQLLAKMVDGIVLQGDLLTPSQQQHALAAIQDVGEVMISLEEFENSRWLIFLFKKLGEAGLLTEEIHAALMRCPMHAQEITGGLFLLKAAGLYTKTNSAILLAHPAHARELAAGIPILHDISSLVGRDLVTEENCSILLLNPTYAKEIAIGLGMLHLMSIRMGQNFVTRLNCAILAGNPTNPEEIAQRIIQDQLDGRAIANASKG